MANSNPYQARIARAEKRRADLGSMLDKLKAAADRAGELVNNEDPATAIRAIHALSQTATSFAKVYETAELAARVEALEDSARMN